MQWKLVENACVFGGRYFKILQPIRTQKIRYTRVDEVIWLKTNQVGIFEKFLMIHINMEVVTTRHTYWPYWTLVKVGTNPRIG